MDDFEADSLRSLKNYLDTLDGLNKAIISKSLNENEKGIEEIIQAFSCVFEVLDGLVTPEEMPDDIEEANKLVHEKTRCIESITMGYIESMKLLNDVLFLCLTGRYASARMLYRGIYENMFRGLFYYGLTQNEHKRKYPKNKAIQSYFDEVSRIKSKQLDIFPLTLRNHMYEWLKQNKKSKHPSLALMVELITEWGLLLRRKVTFPQFWNEVGFRESYSQTSGFVHTAFGTTYSYFETVLEEMEPRKFWGAQFSKEILKHECENILLMIDFVAGLLLNSYPLDLITGLGVTRLNAALRNYPIIQDKLHIVRNSLYALIVHKRKIYGILERAFASQFPETKEITETSMRFLDAKQYDEAVDLLSNARKVNPKNPIINHGLGLAYLESGKARKSLEYFDDAILLYPKFGTAFYNKACALSRLNLIDDSLTNLARAIEIDDAFREMALTDNDFEHLRNHKKFQKTVRKDDVKEGI
jgi:tetratricopeptide (TPR) repeat protein